MPFLHRYLGNPVLSFVGRLLFRAVRFLNALYASSCPTLTVLVRKAFGLAYETLNGRKYHTDGLYAWAGAEIGFMDPEIGVNVLYGDRKTDDEKRAMVAELREGTSPFDAAGVMNIDEVIDPADRYVLFELRVSEARGNGYGDVPLPPRLRWSAAR